MCDHKEKEYSDFDNVEKMRNPNVPEEFPEGSYEFPNDPWNEKVLKPDLEQDLDDMIDDPTDPKN